MSDLTREQVKEYVDAGGVRCPFCGSEDIESDSRVEVDAGGAWQDVSCHTCERSWSDSYRLVGIIEPGE